MSNPIRFSKHALSKCQSAEPRKMKISYDPQVDAMYIRFHEEPTQVTTQRLTEDVAINYAPDGRVVGIEILDASDYIFQSKQEKSIVVQNLIAITA